MVGILIDPEVVLTDPPVSMTLQWAWKFMYKQSVVLNILNLDKYSPPHAGMFELI